MPSWRRPPRRPPRRPRPSSRRPAPGPPSSDLALSRRLDNRADPSGSALFARRAAAFPARHPNPPGRIPGPRRKAANDSATEWGMPETGPSPDSSAGRPLDGRTALVTGGASGIGLACARGLAELGALVTIADLDGAAAA